MSRVRDDEPPQVFLVPRAEGQHEELGHELLGILEVDRDPLAQLGEVSELIPGRVLGEELGRRVARDGVERPALGTAAAFSTRA